PIVPATIDHPRSNVVSPLIAADTTVMRNVALPKGSCQRRSARKSGASRMMFVARTRATAVNSAVYRTRTSACSDDGIRPSGSDGVQSRNADSHWNMNAAPAVASVSESSVGKSRRNDESLGYHAGAYQPERRPAETSAAAPAKRSRWDG